MQVVFLQNIKGIAYKGEIKKVRPGYFRNFLLPKGLAVLATKGKIKETEKIRQEQIIQKERLLQEARKVKDLLDNLVVTIKKKAKEEKLYGSITEKDVISVIEKETKVRLEKEQVKMSEHFKALGKYDIAIHITEGVDAKVTVDVQAEK